MQLIVLALILIILLTIPTTALSSNSVQDSINGTHGIVVMNSDNGGSLFLSASDMSPITPSPTNEQLTEALNSTGNNLASFYESIYSDGEAFFVIKFTNLSNENQYIQYKVKYVLEKRPLNIEISASSEQITNDTMGHTLETIRSDIGLHQVKLPAKYIKNGTTYVRFKALKEFVSGNDGASEIDEIKVSPISARGFFLGNKINLNNGEFKIGNIWLQPLWLVITIISAFLGSMLVVQRDLIAVLSGTIAFLVPFLLDIILNLNLYIISLILNTGIGVAFSAMIHGVLIGIILDISDQKGLIERLKKFWDLNKGKLLNHR
ncbi:MAG TPA: hypothetical protein EYP22_07410 [Methanosarcinales archaeon]|nr:hypothetical protein [Methanosarcinales archaeon]